MDKLDEPPRVSFHRDYTHANIKNLKKQAYKGRSENVDRTVNIPIDNGTFAIKFRSEQTTRSFNEAWELLKFDQE